jgi:hypothetical protein
MRVVPLPPWAGSRLHRAVKPRFVAVLWRNRSHAKIFIRDFVEGIAGAWCPPWRVAGAALPAPSGAIARNALVLTQMVTVLVLATAALVQGDGEFNPVTLLTFFCR